ncbi:MAG: hypothetical protein SangKO_077350 [Sandaracinaceae bacterium]
MSIDRLTVLAALLALVPVTVAAQAPTEADEAERLFHEGASLLEEGRYESARVVLERALALEPRASTGFNLASALQALGQSWEAHQLLTRLEAGELGELDARLQEALVALRRAVAEGLGRLELRVRTPRTVEVFIDDERAGELVSGSVLGRLLPPGPHTLRAVADGHHPFRAQVSLERGQTAPFVIALEPSEATPTTSRADPVEPPAAREPPAGGFDVGLAVGLTVAAVVVLAVVGVIVGVVLADGGAPCDEVIGCVEF